MIHLMSIPYRQSHDGKSSPHRHWRLEIAEREKYQSITPIVVSLYLPLIPRGMESLPAKDSDS